MIETHSYDYPATDLLTHILCSCTSCFSTCHTSQAWQPYVVSGEGQGWERDYNKWLILGMSQV